MPIDLVYVIGTRWLTSSWSACCEHNIIASCHSVVLLSFSWATPELLILAADRGPARSLILLIESFYFFKVTSIHVPAGQSELQNLNDVHSDRAFQQPPLFSHLVPDLIVTLSSLKELQALSISDLTRTECSYSRWIVLCCQTLGEKQVICGFLFTVPGLKASSAETF